MCELPLTNWRILPFRLRLFFLASLPVSASAVLCTCICTSVLLVGDVAGQEEQASVYAHVPVSSEGGVVQLSDVGEKRIRAQLAFARGAQFYSKGDLTAAQQAFESALQLDPSNVELAMRLARIAAALSQPQHGLQILRASLTRNPENVKGYLHLAEFCESVADLLDRQAVTDESGTSESEAAMLRVQAEDVALRAVEKFPQYPSVYWRLLRQYLAQDRKAHAQAMMRLAIAREDTDPYYWLEMGQQAQQAWPLADQEQFDAHLDILNSVYARALVVAGDSAEVIDQIADYFSQTRQYDRAVELYGRVIDLNPGMLLTREKLARVLGVLERHDDKLAALEELVQINPHDVRIRKFIGSEYQGRNDRRRAIAHFLAAIRAGETDAVFYHKLIELMLSEGMQQEALPVIRRAHFLYPDSFPITVQLARVHGEVKDWDSALRAFRSAEKTAEDQGQVDVLDDSFYFEYGNVAKEAGQSARAAHLFRKSTASVPGETPERAAKAYAALAQVWLDQGERIAEAAELIGLAIDLEPETPAYFTSLGRCHYLRGDYVEAVEALRKAEELADEKPGPVILNQLAMALFRMGDVRVAVAVLERAVALPAATSEMRMRLDSYRRGEDFDPLPPEPVEG
ncbi:MAG: tetratricopeptide (TPR) repeat protein [Verrucomicrobiales bacterium]|jgi:tetratricopeptide (TPR) repeat protein